MTPRLLLTGSSGLIGGDILQHFSGLNWPITLASSTPSGLRSAPGISAIPFDLQSVDTHPELSKALKNVDAVIHCAAVMPDGDDPDPVKDKRLFLANTLGTLALMEMAVTAKVSHFVFMSATSKPRNYYVLSKHLGSMMADYFNDTTQTRFYTFRVSAPYGAGYKIKAVIPQFIERALAGEPLELWGKGLREQTFTYVRDISRACELAIEKGVPGSYSIAGPSPVTMRNLAELILELIPNTGSKIVYNNKPDPNEGISRRIPIDAAQQAFGYAPLYDLRKGLAEMVSRLRDTRRPLARIP